MNATVKYMRGNTKCRRVHAGKECGYRESEHASGCPEIPRGEFSKDRGTTGRYSLSMNEDAIDAAKHIVNGLLIGKSAAELRAHKGFKDFAKVVIATAQRAKRKAAVR